MKMDEFVGMSGNDAGMNGCFMQFNNILLCVMILNNISFVNVNISFFNVIAI